MRLFLGTYCQNEEFSGCQLVMIEFERPQVKEWHRLLKFCKQLTEEHKNLASLEFWDNEEHIHLIDDLPSLTTTQNIFSGEDFKCWCQSFNDGFLLPNSYALTIPASNPDTVSMRVTGTGVSWTCYVPDTEEQIITKELSELNINSLLKNAKRNS